MLQFPCKIEYEVQDVVPGSCSKEEKGGEEEEKEEEKEEEEEEEKEKGQEEEKEEGCYPADWLCNLC